VLPGEEIELPPEGDVILGPGIRRERDDTAVAAKCGVLRTRGTTGFWVDTSSKRAPLAVGDEVIGVVVGKPGEVFSVDVGGARPGTLSFLSFEGATRRNRPSVEIEDLLFCRVVAAGKHIDPELSCVNAHGKSGGLGKLDGGFMFKGTTGLCRSLRNPTCPILSALSPHIAFEMAAGLNGRIWVKGETAHDTIFVYNALKNAEHMTVAVAETFVKQLVSRMPRS